MATVAGAAQSVGIGVSVGASAAVITATAAATVAVASASGLLSLANTNSTSSIGTCDYPNLGYRFGNITMFMEGIPRVFTLRESKVLEDLIVDAYNNASGICLDILQREMLNARLVEQTYYPELAGNEDILVRSSFAY